MNYIDKFLEYEKENKLLEENIEGFYYWGYIRFLLYSKIVNKIENLSESTKAISNYSTFKKVRVGLRLLYNSIVYNPFFKNQSLDILVLNHSRKMKVNDEYESIYIDDILSKFPNKYLVLDPLNQEMGHYSLKNINSISYEDFITIYSEIYTKVKGSKCLKLSDRLNGIIDDLENLYNISIDRKSIIQTCLRLKVSHRIKTKLYKKLLLKLRPKLILEVVYYTPNKMIINEIAKELNIPVIELQHGTMGMHHIAYNFLDKNQLPYFPDQIMLFSNYWKEHTRFPINRNNLLVTGFPYLERRVNETKHLDKGNKNEVNILFISQTTIGEKLSKFAVELYELLNEKNENVRIMYKFHPSESVNWEERFPWLAKYKDNIDVISDNTRSIYEYFAISDIQVGVYSTALFEGLAYQLETYVVKYYGYQYLEDVCNSNYATLIETPKDFYKNFKSKSEKENVEEFWESDSLIKTSNVIMKKIK